MSGLLTPAEAFDAGLAGEPWHLELEDGRTLPVPFERFTGTPTPGELRVLARARGPVLDVGCGPGRHVHALADRGVLALGLDISAVAIGLARRRGAPVMRGSVFSEVPEMGRWATVLLLDGNLGIGGDPVRLLERLRAVLAPGGSVLAECADPRWGAGGTLRVRLVGPGGPSAEFGWALLDAAALRFTAPQAGLSLDEVWSDEGRTYARLGVGP